MNNLDGKLIIAMIMAYILAWLSGLWVSKRYTQRVLALMQTKPISAESLEFEQPIIDFPIARKSLLPHSNLSEQNRIAVWRLRMAVVAISMIIAVVITMVLLYADEIDITWRRIVSLVLMHASVVVPGIGLLERWSHWKIVSYLLAYIGLNWVLVILYSNDTQSGWEVLMLLMGDQVLLLIFMLFLTRPNLRAIGPYVFVVFFLLTLTSTVGFSILEHAVSADTDNWLMSFLLALKVDPLIWILMFQLLPLLPGLFLARWLARQLAEAYQHKAFSEPLYLLGNLWFLMLFNGSTSLSHSRLGLVAYVLLLAWLMIPLSMRWMESSLRPEHQPPTLLLLRVFRDDSVVEELFDEVIERWRYSGNTVLIVGKDLALRNLEPDELFAFLSGRLKDRFISHENQLIKSVQNLDFASDPDGRFRVNEFFCFDNTWKAVLAALVNKADRVLMDLRGFNHNRHGCTHELQVLANQAHLDRLIILFNRATDKSAAEVLLAKNATKVIWIDSEAKHGLQLQTKLLEVLLGANTET